MYNTLIDCLCNRRTFQTQKVTDIGRYERRFDHEELPYLSLLVDEGLDVSNGRMRAVIGRPGEGDGTNNGEAAGQGLLEVLVLPLRAVLVGLALEVDDVLPDIVPSGIDGLLILSVGVASSMTVGRRVVGVSLVGLLSDRVLDPRDLASGSEIGGVAIEVVAVTLLELYPGFLDQSVVEVRASRVGCVPSRGVAQFSVKGRNVLVGDGVGGHVESLVEVLER